MTPQRIHQAARSRSPASLLQTQQGIPFSPRRFASSGPEPAQDSPSQEPYEREAERVADRVTQSLGPSSGREVPPALNGSSRSKPAVDYGGSGGRPLPESLRHRLGHSLGADLNPVRVHTDARADRLNRSLDSNAATVGGNIFFRQGAYQPESRAGQKLIAHEAVHTVHQGAVEQGGVGDAGATIGLSQSPLCGPQRSGRKRSPSPASRRSTPSSESGEEESGSEETESGSEEEALGTSSALTRPPAVSALFAPGRFAAVAAAATAGRPQRVEVSSLEEVPIEGAPADLTSDPADRKRPPRDEGTARAFGDEHLHILPIESSHHYGKEGGNVAFHKPEGRSGHLVRQGAKRSCGPACMLMLAHDQGVLGSTQDNSIDRLTQTHELRGLVPKGLELHKTTVTGKSPQEKLASLKQHLQEHGPAVVGMDMPHPMGGHFVVADEVAGEGDQQHVVVREPYHGMVARVAGEHFVNQMDNDDEGVIHHMKPEEVEGGASSATTSRDKK